MALALQDAGGRGARNTREQHVPIAGSLNVVTPGSRQCIVL
jgi:hypothetical protein